jgi:hypothetical protein
MSVPYTTLIRQCALRINAIYGPISATLQTNYLVSPLTTTEVVSSIFPLASIIDAVLDTEAALAKAIGETANSSLRQYLAGQTSSLANYAFIPSTSSASKPIIGVWDAVIDASDSTPCSLMPLDEVRRRAANANTQFVVGVYWFNLIGRQIVHTRPNVIIKCCVYSRSDQATTLAANGNILLADALAPAYVDGAVGRLVRDDEFAVQAAAASAKYDRVEAAIRAGNTTIIPEVMEIPSTAAA